MNTEKFAWPGAAVIAAAIAGATYTANAPTTPPENPTPAIVTPGVTPGVWGPLETQTRVTNLQYRADTAEARYSILLDSHLKLMETLQRKGYIGNEIPKPQKPTGAGGNQPTDKPIGAVNES